VVIQGSFEGGKQQNLQNRVSAVTFHPGITDEENSIYQSAIFYTYDVHGNVTRQVKDNNNEVYSKLFQNKKIKSIDYEFDLISGNVRKVTYQKDKSDQFIHKYEYDLDNRLSIVSTSKDGEEWTQDGKYLYNDIGDLARYEIGDVNST